VTLTSPLALGAQGAHVTDVAQVLAQLTLMVGDDGMQQLLVHDDSFRVPATVGVAVMDVWWEGDGGGPSDTSDRGRR
jgi:hypothetical protein